MSNFKLFSWKINALWCIYFIDCYLKVSFIIKRIISNKNNYTVLKRYLFNLFYILKNPYIFIYILGKWSEVAQLCPTLCDPMDCSLPGTSVHGIFQARILEWVAISFSRGSSQPMDQTQVSCIVGRHFTIWATREATGW